MLTPHHKPPSLTSVPDIIKALVTLKAQIPTVMFQTLVEDSQEEWNLLQQQRRIIAIIHL